MPAAVSRTFSASALAAACGGRLVGEDVPAVGRVRSLEAAGPGDLAFATDVPAQRRAASCAAGVVLAHSAGLLAGRTVIEAADPSAALAAILFKAL